MQDESRDGARVLRFIPRSRKERSLLVVDPDVRYWRLRGDDFKRADFAVRIVSSLREAGDYLKGGSPHGIVTEARLDDGSGLDLLTLAGALESRVVIVAGEGTPELEARALKLGAADFLLKADLDFDRLTRSLTGVPALANAGTE